MTIDIPTEPPAAARPPVPPAGVHPCTVLQVADAEGGYRVGLRVSAAGDRWRLSQVYSVPEFVRICHALGKRGPMEPEDLVGARGDLRVTTYGGRSSCTVAAP